MAESGPTLTSLAEQISKITSTITTYLEEKRLTAPSFAADSPTNFPNLSPELFQQRQVLLDAINDLQILVQGPSESVFNYVHTAAPDVAALNVLNYFDFWATVPLDGSASYAEIAARVKLPEDVVKRILQHSTNLRLFAETEPGKQATRIRHSSRSAAVAKNSGLKSLIQAILDDAGPPTTILHEALQRYSRGKPELTQEQRESAFALLHSGGMYSGHTNYFEYQESGDGWRSRSYTKFMGYLKEIFHMENLVLDLKDWKAVGKASVVDVGGSAGHDAVVLAKTFPDLTLTVQDLPKVRTQFEATVPEELKERISFSEHNFLEPQSVRADIYLLKMILHDWADADAIKILQALRPALKPGARVVLLEYIGDRGETETPLPRSMRQWGTATDLRLMALFNTKERQVDAWKRLFNAADERFDVAEVNTKQEDFFAVVEATWRG
ncbi:sterigmatocystin 8-O-methyltransferase [Lentithecium fluviatile CBS 122367]|uniref:Sterigmatocystin 8-O-methyltransferase n=1 Tax=Lentithecium fluviatile CBS 122367 TaxID=1168545 RepID=A0A6G1J0Y0_9PLEO|nr:sterigmatocystin 8-O-methyltransferase [Lentithecium fluviatile CBS 122367]